MEEHEQFWIPCSIECTKTYLEDDRRTLRCDYFMDLNNSKCVSERYQKIYGIILDMMWKQRKTSKKSFQIIFL